MSDLNLYVVKKNGNTEFFRREKLLNSILMACNKSGDGAEVMEHLAEDIEKEIRSNDMAQIHSSLLGSMVLNKLKEFDKVSYLRFLSIHRGLDFNKLKKEIKDL